MDNLHVISMSTSSLMLTSTNYRIWAMRMDVFLEKCAKESAKESSEVLHTIHVGMDRVVQAKVQALKREFGIISMKRNEKVDDYSNFFAQVFTNLSD